MRDTPLTSDERARLPEFITHWARISLSAQPIEHSAAERAIAALYAWTGLPKPRIVWAPCPMTVMIGGGTAVVDTFDQRVEDFPLRSR